MIQQDDASLRVSVHRKREHFFGLSNWIMLLCVCRQKFAAIVARSSALLRHMSIVKPAPND